MGDKKDDSIDVVLYLYSILYFVDISDYMIDELQWSNCAVKWTFFVLIINTDNQVFVKYLKCT
jgi:hypothetical protein